MSKPIVRVYSAPGEFEDREMNDQEFAQYEIDQASLAAKKAEADAKTALKKSAMDKLTALGLTAEEIATLIK